MGAVLDGKGADLPTKMYQSMVCVGIQSVHQQGHDIVLVLINGITNNKWYGRLL